MPILNMDPNGSVRHVCCFAVYGSEYGYSKHGPVFGSVYINTNGSIRIRMRIHYPEKQNMVHKQQNRIQLNFKKTLRQIINIVFVLSILGWLATRRDYIKNLTDCGVHRVQCNPSVTHQLIHCFLHPPLRCPPAPSLRRLSFALASTFLYGIDPL
jgi:hypothetical protein